jgi:hypothetical protein
MNVDPECILVSSFGKFESTSTYKTICCSFCNTSPALTRFISLIPKAAAYGFVGGGRFKLAKRAYKYARKVFKKSPIKVKAHLRGEKGTCVRRFFPLTLSLITWRSIDIILPFFFPLVFIKLKYFFSPLKCAFTLIGLFLLTSMHEKYLKRVQLK